MASSKALYPLIDELLFLMKKLKMDYTNTFYFYQKIILIKVKSNYDFIKWEKKWIDSVKRTNCIKESKSLMKKYNPVFIARNHIVEESIKKLLKEI